MTRPLAFAVPGDIATLTGGFIYERRLLEGLRRAGHDVLHLELPAGFPDPSPPDMAAAVAALAAVAPDRPLILDGLVFGSIDTAGLARVRAPLVAMIHHPLAQETGLSPARRDHLFRTERDNLRLARHVLVPSPHTRRILTARYGVPPDAITVLRPGVDQPRLPPAPAAPPLILSVGILHPRKGHDVLIRALSLLPDLDWQAVIVGNLWDRDHAAALARQRAASPAAHRIRLAGRVSDDDLQALYARAAIFALATWYEGHGIVFDEALVRGLPIVSCDAGAVPDTVPQGAGLLVAPGDAQAFAAALRSLLQAPDRRRAMAKAALAAGAGLPGWQQMADRASLVLSRI
ncbi:GDP-mannose-dependent alpha-(1-6)-phosphatidylinositol monomannoside mannosyltransferase [Paracoccus haematequi]|uniref:GDP-mannose-dependent alpha-(1-6)-phosphatidylinositol monomannoside mannosyltransferase n=1 Tax=Paracoccus haematequi TaxID=2491866 RepID=A0A447IMK0_9RHOB|nr:glycosyltransferase family 4 protein [Paracoccus haematequi]VDS08726.1 GDP-mannose-dependent alpha-(1-6)-phosphatidylinositol monomannoside mannosyltransferase [Paracoccus haematequi]